MEEPVFQMEIQIVLDKLENNAKKIVINQFLIKKLIILIQLGMIQVIHGIGKKGLILEFIEIRI
jgi:hypothetical protein